MKEWNGCLALINSFLLGLLGSWNAMRAHHNVVQSHTVVWHKDYLPKCHFILWLVSRNGVKTKDKVMQWGCVTEAVCLLFGKLVMQMNQGITCFLLALFPSMFGGVFLPD